MPKLNDSPAKAVQPNKPRVTMHDDVETWVDTCSCEPEPRWQALAEELEEEQQKRRRDQDEQRTRDHDPS